MSLFKRIAFFVAGKPIVDPQTGNPTSEFLRALNHQLDNLRVSGSQLAQMVEDIEASLTQAGIAITTAEAAAAAVAAQGASQALVDSYVSPNSILSSDIDSGDTSKRTIIVANHDRIYGNSTTVAVTGATLSGLDAGTFYFVYYDDASRAGGAVTFVATQDPAVAVQGGNRHTVGSITTVASGETTPTNGGGTTGPGIPYKDGGYQYEV